MNHPHPVPDEGFMRARVSRIVLELPPPFSVEDVARAVLGGLCDTCIARYVEVNRLCCASHGIEPLIEDAIEIDPRVV